MVIAFSLILSFLLFRLMVIIQWGVKRQEIDELLTIKRWYSSGGMMTPWAETSVAYVSRSPLSRGEYLITFKRGGKIRLCASGKTGEHIAKLISREGVVCC